MEMTNGAPITRILVANRGEIASRVFRTARSLGIATVAVYSDADANSAYVRAADRAVHLPGLTSTETYLDAELILAAALAAGADAIHPGYGFLSENPAFARAVQAAGLTWIGPTPQSIEAMAWKVEAKQIAENAGVPLVPGAQLPDGISESEQQNICDGVGYPLLIKASAGGGGKGMRVVLGRDDLITSLQSARREAMSAFGDDTVFVERYLTGARHVEVQVFGDTHGNVVHLFERECSIQRRHQKIVEEAPSPGVTEAVRQRLFTAAVGLARAIDYVGAGTVEFMVFGAGADQEFYFLEMNTRLQVEHPVTEEITGQDLVAWQILVAQGQVLPRTQDEIFAAGHAIEARLYAEDPATGDLPATGTIYKFTGNGRSAAGQTLRIESGVCDGSVISPYYDPMLAKVISHAPSRQVAAAVLADGLARMTLHGPVTNRDSLVAILRHEAFVAGDTKTTFLDEHPQVRTPSANPHERQRHAIAVAFALEALANPQALVPIGWSNVPAAPQFFTMRARAAADFTNVFIGYSRGGVKVRIAESESVPFRDVFALVAAVIEDVDAHTEVLDDSHAIVTVRIGSLSARCSIARYGDEIFVDDGVINSAWILAPRFADHSADAIGHGPATTMPGTITAVEVAPGDAVVVGQTLVMLEAMKMEHRIISDVDGIVLQVFVEVGQSVDAHLVVVELEESADATESS